MTFTPWQVWLLQMACIASFVILLLIHDYFLGLYRRYRGGRNAHKKDK